MKGWELLIYLILAGLLAYLLFKLIFHIVMADQYNSILNYVKIDEQAETIHNFFENYPIYYINLDRAADRRAYLEEMFDKYQIKNVTRIQGVDGKNVDVEYKVIGYTKYSPGELGCSLSHIRAIKTAYENGDEIAVIIEDDCGFGLLSQNKLSLQQIINLAPPDWEYLNLCPLNPMIHLYNETFVPDVNFTGYGTSVYVINRKGMEKILLFLGDNVFDQTKCKSWHLASDIILPYLTKSYSYKERIFYQNRTFPTQITNSSIP
jgi:GR25 family glycosyltransferase involved in LPS biosynthesis